MEDPFAVFIVRNVNGVIVGHVSRKAYVCSI